MSGFEIAGLVLSIVPPFAHGLHQLWRWLRRHLKQTEDAMYWGVSRVQQLADWRFLNGEVDSGAPTAAPDERRLAQAVLVPPSVYFLYSRHCHSLIDLLVVTASCFMTGV